MDLYSYVVRYDSGFAPNPFYGCCTLATCKPNIRKSAKLGDWVVGCASADKKIGLSGRLTYAMKITEIATFNQYFNDLRFQSKKPILTGSKKQARGDNIYNFRGQAWRQLDSFHSNVDGSPKAEHINRDTKVNRVLISTEYFYFGGGAKKFPKSFVSGKKPICHKGRNQSKFSDTKAKEKIQIDAFLDWIQSLGVSGYIDHPYDWNDKQ